MDKTKNENFSHSQEICDNIERPNLLGVRHIQSLLLFLGITFGYFLRVNISAAIVPMTQPTAGQAYYDWDSFTQSLILSSFFWGYVVAQMPASLLAKRFGAKIVICLATAMASVFTILHPLAANNGNWQAVCCLRVLVGLTQGSVYPCTHTVLAKWLPSTERGFLGTFVYAGVQFGTAVVLAVSGFVFNSVMGWPGLFYITGAIGLGWSAMYFVFGANTPRDTKIISKVEQEYIEALTGCNQEPQSMPIPWKSILTSAPLYGLIAAYCGFTWGFFTLLTEMPTYMNRVLHLDINSDGLLSSLPYFVMLVLSLVFSPISDMLINRKVFSVTFSRKLFATIGSLIPAVCLIVLGYMTEDDTTLAVALITIGVSCNAIAVSGYLVNHIDLSPNFAGLMMAITNGISNICSICAPLVVGGIVTNEEDPDQWRIVFFISAAIYLLSVILFVIFGDATIQKWNDQYVSHSIKQISNNFSGKNSKEIHS